MNKKKSCNTSETTEQIVKLLELKTSVYQEIYNAEKEISRLKKTIDKLEKTLMDLCDHEWEYEHYSGMYDKPDKVCKLCHSRIIRF
jgi:chromosome segregation ATPase